MRFFSNPHKPMILALARPDPKKNLTTLVKAFGECRPLRDLANLVWIISIHIFKYNFFIFCLADLGCLSEQFFSSFPLFSYINYG